MTDTNTYAVLEVTQATFEEIKDALTRAGYERAFHKDSNGRPLIDMQGLALAQDRVSLTKTIFVNGLEQKFTGYDISYEQLVKLAYPDKPVYFWTATFYAKMPNGSELSGCMREGKTVTVFERMRFTVMDTSNA